jgi:hypothetical protein
MNYNEEEGENRMINDEAVDFHLKWLLIPCADAV